MICLKIAPPDESSERVSVTGERDTWAFWNQSCRNSCAADYTAPTHKLHILFHIFHIRMILSVASPTVASDARLLVAPPAHHIYYSKRHVLAAASRLIRK
ncbi:hypothetical protein F2P81_015877 [Scophthalmus maximus]|uniref:Uncharacterized protein n=1 Tax=Scophthalmus maximus TaxID=52904 RepID=A0A6A4SLX6_SCOMX|nr:hypothetical protein F2P81_015877 [Scophthalmus maximus]